MFAASTKIDKSTSSESSRIKGKFDEKFIVLTKLPPI